MIDKMPSEILTEVLLQTAPTSGLFVRPSPTWKASDGWPLFYGFMPATPDDCACVYGTQGIQHGKVMRTGEVIEHHGVEIIVRANNYNNMRSSTITIVNTLDPLFNRDVAYQGSTYRLFAATRTSSIRDLPEELEKQRRRCTVNYLLALKKL